MTVSLRSMPYPFKALVSISSDTDMGMIWQHEFGRFLRTNEVTRFGTGLGLDIGDSFWLFDYPQTYALTPTVWKGDYGTSRATALVPAAEWVVPEMVQQVHPGWISPVNPHEEVLGGTILKYILCGWIDAVHGFGDFDSTLMGRTGVTGGRPAWEAAMAWWEQHGLSRFVNHWIDHRPYYDQSGQRNLVGAYSEWMCRAGAGGDPEATAWYHGDVTRDAVRFGWWTEYFDGYTQADVNIWTYFDYITPPEVAETRTRITRDSLIAPRTLFDGSKFWGFDRWMAPDAPEGAIVMGFHFQLLNSRLAEIVSQGGFLSLYTHFGQHAWGSYGCSWEAESVLAAQNLKAQQDVGNILVARQSRALVYNLVRDNVVFDAQEVNGVATINVTHVVDECYGNFVPTVEQLRGLTFYVEDSAQSTLSIAGVPVAESEIQRNAADETAVASIGVAWFPQDSTDYTAWTLSEVQDKFSGLESSLTATTHPGYVELTWADSATGEDGWRVERRIIT